MKKLLPKLVQSSELVVGSKQSLRSEEFKKKISTNHELRTNNSFGFTLVELLVVVAIIAVLSVIGITIFTGVQKGARDARRRGDIDAIFKALEAHVNTTTNQYCGTAAAPAAAGTYCAPQSSTSWFASGAIPVDPSTGASYTGLPVNGAATYTVCATLESGGTFCRSNQQ